MDHVQDRQASLPDLASRTLQDMSELLEREFELARHELEEHSRALGRRLVPIGVGGGLAFAGCVATLTTAANRMASRGRPRAALLLAGGSSLLGALLVVGGALAARRSELAPRRALRSLSKDVSAVKEAFR